MLSRLYIESFALIERAEIEFGPGLNVITGETGAGKSILMGALNAILGAPASADLVRSGAEKCIVEGLFETDVDDAGEDGGGSLFEDGQLILRREIRAHGRSRSFVNGAALPFKNLHRLGRLLVDLHGQHEHQTLLDVENHRRFLDETGRLTDLAGKVARGYRDFVESDRSLQRLVAERHDLHKESELRRFQLDEIRRIAPEPDEEEALEQEVRVLENQESLVETTAQLRHVLYEDEDSIVDQLGKARRSLSQLSETDPALQTQAQSLDELIAGVGDIAGQLSEYGHRLQADPHRLEQTRDRLHSLRTLRRKYGDTLADVIALADQLEDGESRSRQLEQEIDGVENGRDRCLEEFSRCCVDLSRRRRDACGKLARAVEEGLRSLGMAHAAFSVGLQRREIPDGLIEEDGRRFAADENGLEKVELSVSANAGEEPRPLARIASGGEISRIMLVLKEIIAHRDLVSTLVFDEIDAGISGRIAAAVGRRLQRLAESHQVVVITHLPQIASLADRHFAVHKRVRDGRTVTEVELLDEAGRADEIAALLAGDTVSDTARQHAEEMLR